MKLAVMRYLCNNYFKEGYMGALPKTEQWFIYADYKEWELAAA